MTAWDKVLQHMERRVNPHSFATWFRPTRQEGTETGKLIVRVPTRMFRKRLSETYGELIHAVLNEVGMQQTRVEFVCSEPEPAPADPNVTSRSLFAARNPLRPPAALLGCAARVSGEAAGIATAASSSTEKSSFLYIVGLIASAVVVTSTV